MAAIVALTSSIVSNGAAAEGLTRAQVTAEMAEYEQAGYNPARANPKTWVEDAQQATQRVEAARRAAAQRAQQDGPDGIYSHH